MDGMTRAQVDRAESADIALGKGPMRPRDAATLILLDRSQGIVRVLMGRRSMKHAFMPGRYVFPGGRTDPDDARIPLAAPLPEPEHARLVGTRRTGARARAIALSAVRETYEEAGILIGRPAPFDTRKEGWSGFVQHGIAPSLDGLRVVARAITPPKRVRRFDTFFLAAWIDSAAKVLPEGGPTQELESVDWLTFDEARRQDLPMITGTVIGELERRLAEDPDLSPGGPACFYRMVGGVYQRVPF